MLEEIHGKTLFDISNGVFYEISQSTIDEINFRISDKIEFPIIEKTPKCRVVVPKPRKVNGDYFFEGCVFENYDEDYETIWSLYLATVSHMAAHAKISDYSKYENWMKNKTFEKCQKVIDFVEDVRVEEHLKKFPDIWQNIISIKTTLDDLEVNKISNHSNEKFYHSFCVKRSSEIQKLREKLSQMDDIEINEIVPYLDFIYKNQELLPKNSLPYCIHHNGGFSQNDLVKKLKIQPLGEFARIVADMDDVWNKEVRKSGKKLSEYQNYAEDSHFDEVSIGIENLAEFSRLTDESAGILQRLRTSVRTLSNIVDTPANEDAGLIDMQLAIQREACQKDIQIFEQDVPRTESENWVVIIDASASMISKFEEMKKMALCLSEAAEEINQSGGKWGLYSFNNNFLIVKDHVEGYNQQTKARIGGIENKGLSLIPDAVNMGIKILKKDKESTHKYLILISDGQAYGYRNIDECFKKSLLSAKQNNINVVGIGVPQNLSRYFSFTIDTDDPQKTVDKFMGAYSYLTQTMK